MPLVQGETIIYFGPEPWSGLWRNRHQLMSRFAAQNDVWYVEPPAMIRDVLGLKRRDGSSSRPLRSALFSRDASGVRIFHSPWWLPVTGRIPLRNISIRIFLAALSLTTRIGSRRRPIVWFSRPDMVHYIGKLKAKLTIYHVVDEYSGYRHLSGTEIAEPDDWEIELLRQADVVIVVTPALYDLKSPYNSNTHIVPNAVDYDAYLECDVGKPDDMADIQGPIIGYSGLVAARLDLEMLREAAEARPRWNFVFVGTVNDAQCETGMQELRDMPNVYMLGHKQVHDLPRYVRQFDVCVIPYVVNLRAKHASPLKLYEYAAASRPIVATDFAAAHAFEGHVSIAGDAGDFVSACEQALAVGSSAPPVLENRDIAAENTWVHRVQQISGIIEQAIG